MTINLAALEAQYEFEKNNIEGDPYRIGVAAGLNLAIYLLKAEEASKKANEANR